MDNENRHWFSTNKGKFYAVLFHFLVILPLIEYIVNKIILSTNNEILFADLYLPWVWSIILFFLIGKPQPIRILNETGIYQFIISYWLDIGLCMSPSFVTKRYLTICCKNCIFLKWKYNENFSNTDKIYKCRKEVKDLSNIKNIKHQFCKNFKSSIPNNSRNINSLNLSIKS